MRTFRQFKVGEEVTVNGELSRLVNTRKKVLTVVGVKIHPDAVHARQETCGRTNCNHNLVHDQLVTLDNGSEVSGAWFDSTYNITSVPVVIDDTPESSISDDVVMAIMRNIASESDPRGHFLTYFAKAMCQADLDNQRILLPVAHELVKKYKI